MTILAEAPSSLDGLASAASVLIIIEVLLIVVLLAAVALLIALGGRWLHTHVVPLLSTNVPRAKRMLNQTDRTLGRVVDVLAELYARERGVEHGVHSFLAAILPGFFTPTSQGEHDETTTEPS